MGESSAEIPAYRDGMPIADRWVGEYRVVRRVATGPFGQLYLGHDDGLDRPVTIKRIRANADISAAQRKRLQRQARLLAQLDHAAIVRIYDLIEVGDVSSIVMEYVEGSTLAQLIANGPPPLRYALGVLIEVTDALSQAHRLGIVHRDLKTEGILITTEGHPKIADFGLAKNLAKSTQEELTKPTDKLGTYRAMSPEQAWGKAVDHRSDLFSLGVLIYETITGQSPFYHANDLVTMSKLTGEPHPPLQQFSDEIPPALAELIDRLLEKDPADRPQSTRKVLRRLALIATETFPDLYGSDRKASSRDAIGALVRGLLHPNSPS